MPNIQDHQISQLLRVAMARLTYSKYIASYPASKGKNGFDTIATLDGFYKNVCNTSFHDSLLVTIALLDEKNRGGVSLWNWRDMKSRKAIQLKDLSDALIATGLKTMRDQIVGHVDADNQTNNFPMSREQGIVNGILINRLEEIQCKIKDLFFDFTTEIGQPHAKSFFDQSEAMNEIQTVMNAAPPVLTDAILI